MATFTASPLTSPEPNVQYNLPADLGAAQQIQQGQNSLTLQAQQVADMQAAVALRPGIAAGDPNAMNQLTVIDPQAAQAQRQAQIANATMPLQISDARVGYLSKVATGLLAVPPAQRPAAYSFALSQMPQGMAASLPQEYPGDGATQQMAFAGGNVSDAVKYLQNAIQPAGGAPAAGTPPSSYAGAVAGAESGGNAGATNPASSAAGADQFINSTWLDEIKQHRPDLAQGKTDQQILAMRSDPNLSAQMTNDYAQDNTPALQQHNIPITPVSLYAAHHFGKGGAIDLYAAEANNPNTPVSAIFPSSVIQANPGLAGQTADTLLSGLRARMKGVPSGTFGPAIAATPPVVQGPSGGYAPAPAGAPAAPVQPASYQPAVGPGAAAAPPGITPLYHGDGTPAVAPDQPGYQLGRNQQGQIVPFPMSGGKADPAVIARNKSAEAQASASAAGPIPGGAAVAPPQRPGGGPFPLPPTDPYAGANNNAALASRENTDRDAANATVAADAPIIQKDIANIQFDQQFHGVNSASPTGPYQSSGLAMGLRAAGDFFGGGNSDPYQEMRKLSANLQTAALPTNLGRLDLPIIKSVAAQQPDISNKRPANDDIENIQIASAQRDIDYRKARGQWVQQYGNLSGFEQMWNDYSLNVPTLSWNPGHVGTVRLASGQPSFQQWASIRAPGGRYNPALASVPDSQLSGGSQGQPQPQGEPQQPQTQQASANPPPATNTNAPRLPQQQQASVAIGQTATGPNGVRMRWDGQQWDATGGGH